MANPRYIPPPRQPSVDISPQGLIPHQRHVSRRPHRPGGFTLLELMLALMLLGLVLMALGTAVDVHLRAFDSGRDQVEEAQLARTVLRMIAEDLRSVIRTVELDLEGLQVSGGGDTGGGGEEEEEEDEFASGAFDEEEEATSTAEAALAGAPGLYGTQFDLQIDISRPPRVDQYEISLSDETGLYSVPSDIKSVAYYVVDASTTTLADGGTGLVRRELDRTISQYAVDIGNFDLLDADAQVLAPEVVALEFMYFDGVEWLTEWDSESSESLPVAIEVGICVMPSTSPEVTQLSGPLDLATLEAEGHPVYRMVVTIPAAEIGADDAQSEDTTDEGDEAAF